MTRNINLGLLILLILSIASILGINHDPSKPGYEFMPDMVHSVPFDAYAENPVFADGTTLQPPASGTIPRGYLPLHYEATPEDAARAGAELSNPYSMDEPDAVKRGTRVYGIYCLPCHGGKGNGDGLVSQRGFPPPPPLSAENALKMTDGQIFHVITYGQKNMPAYAAQIPREDRWKAILHVRELQTKATSVTEAPAQ